MSGVCDAQDHHHHPEMKCQYEAEHCFISFPVCYIYCLQVILDLTSGPANPMPMYWIYGSQEFAKWQKHLTCKRNGHNFENRVTIVLQRQCPRPMSGGQLEIRADKRGHEMRNLPDFAWNLSIFHHGSSHSGGQLRLIASNIFGNGKYFCRDSLDV